MSVTISTQQSDWNSNVYAVTVTRVLLSVGIFYLVRSVVQLVQWSCSPVPSRQIHGEQPNGPDPSSTCTANQVIDCVAVPDEDTAMDMEDLVSDALDAVGTAANPVEVVELQLPQPSFNLRNILYRTRSLSTPNPEPGSFTVPVDDLEGQTHGGTALAQNNAVGNTPQSG